MRPRRALPALAIGAALALLAAEVALRLAGFDPIGEFRERASPLIRASSVPGLRYELTPRAAGVQWDCEVVVSSVGLRDREHLPTKPPGARRVALLGDSIAFGIGVPVDSTFATLVERELSGARVEVVNFAVPGYDVHDHAAVLEHRALGCEPDLVLVAYAINDAGLHSFALEHVEEVERYSSRLYDSRVAQWLAREAHRRETTAWFARVNADREFARRFEGRIAPLDPGLEERRSEIERELAACGAAAGEFAGWYASPTKLGRLRWSLERMARVAGGTPVLVVYVPYLDEAPCPTLHARIRALVAAECRRAGLAFVDPGPELGRLSDPVLRLTPGDPLHLSAAGHQRFAAVLARHVLAALER